VYNDYINLENTMSKYFTMTNFWLFVGGFIVCTLPWLALAAIIAFFAFMYFCTPSSAASDVCNPDSTVEWPAIEYPNLTAALDEEKAVAEARALKAKYEEAKQESARAKRTATYIKYGYGAILAVGAVLIIAQ
jgi:hypothetical protein